MISIIYQFFRVTIFIEEMLFDMAIKNELFNRKAC